MQQLKNWSLFLFFLASVFFMEIILRITTVGGSLFSIGVVITLIFSLGLAVILYLLSSLFKPSINRIITISLLSLTAILFGSQLVYHDIFTTFYSVYSAAQAGQAFQFWREAVEAIVANLPFVSLLFLPAILVLVLGKKFLTFSRQGWPLRGVLVGLIIFSYGSGLAVVNAGEHGQASAYALYYDRNVPVQSVTQLGLLTTMRLDVQRQITGWVPTVELPPPVDTPVWVPEPIEEKKPIEYNVLQIDFDALIEAEKNNSIQEMHQYFGSQIPTEKNDFTGKYQGYNLILITAEGFSHIAVREDVTPTLYKFSQEGYKFTDFYTPLWGVSTSDGEYVACTGLIPKAGVWSFKRSAKNSMPMTMGNQLRQLGYQTVAYHNHSYKYYGRNLSHPNMGYVYKGVGNGLEMKKTWPRSDLEMMEKTIPEYIGDHQFHAYYMTVSGHLNYTFGGNNMAAKNKKFVKDLPFSETARAYLACQIELDRAMEYLVQELELAGVADKTLIAISADHYPYGLETSAIEELAGEEVKDNFDLYRNAFLLWTKDMEGETIDEPVSSLDIIPTLSNLLGLDYDSRLFMGRDIHSQADPLVIFADGSFITDKGRFDANTGKFEPLPGVSVEEDYVEAFSANVARKVYFSAMILDNDYYAKILPE